MKIAIAVIGSEVSQHFGQSESFYIYEVEGSEIKSREIKKSPGQGHSLIGGFLKENGVELVISGCMGEGAFNGLKSQAIKVLTGAEGTPDEIIKNYIEGKLNLKEYGCIHAGGHHHGHH